MPAYTPNLNLYKPGGGSTGLITPDEVADIDRLNGNFDIIDTFAGDWGDPASFGRNYYGTASAIGSVTDMKLGDTYQETDGDRRLWRYDGTNWLLNEAGVYRIRPSSVEGAGVSIASDGSVVFSNAPATGIHIEGLFSSRFRVYNIDFIVNYASTPGSSLQLQFRNGSGTAGGATDYLNARIFNSSGAVLYEQTNVAHFTTSGGTGARHSGSFTLDAPNLAEVTSFVLDSVSVQGSNVLLQNRITGMHNSLAAYTGLALSSSGSQQIVSGVLRVYGKA